MGVLDVVGHEHDRRPRLDERPRFVGVLPEHRGAHHQHQVVAAQRLAQPGPAGREVAGEQRVVLREARARREALLPHRAAQPFGQPHQRGPGVHVVGVGAHHEGR
jgi:hypothetical protein